MGFDISNHAIDTKLIADTLIPAIIAQKPLGDFADRAAALSAVAARANQWSLRTVRLDHDISTRQRDVGPQRIVRQPRKDGGFLGKLLGRPQHEEFTLPAKTSGLPGFDSDLCTWGRPFFIVADDVDESLATLDRYMDCAGKDLGTVDTLAKEMLARLQTRRHRVPVDLDPAVMRVLDHFYPLLDHLPARADDDGGDVNLEATRSRIAAQFEPYIEAWPLRDSGEEIEHELLEDSTPAADLARGTPFMLINMASQLLPGWMGRGHVWPTALFDKIGVNVSDLFETPAALFDPLVKQLPSLEETFESTIVENYCLGGYVPPAKVAALEQRLRQHERDLVLAWSEQKTVSEEEFEALSSDYRKILEPVVLAQRRGYGFMEAAEVYSGILGIMN